MSRNLKRTSTSERPSASTPQRPAGIQSASPAMWAAILQAIRALETTRS